MKKQLHYLSLLILLSLCGCEVTLHDNYVETEPLPLETPIEIKLDAEQNSSGELLLIEGLKVGFQINTPESRLISASFYIEMCIRDRSIIRISEQVVSGYRINVAESVFFPF